MSSKPSKQNPFVGPRPFERKDDGLFFGRDREASEIFSLIIAHRTLLVYAQSGAGKTSLINAKIIPQLENEGFDVFPIARLQRPISQSRVTTAIKNIFVFNTLLSITGEDANPNLLADLSLSDFLNRKSTSDDSDKADLPKIIIFDQFEEIFNLYLDRWEEREAFFNQIRDVVERSSQTSSQNESPPLWVVFVMREDYIAQLDPYLSILPGKLRTRYRLERLKGEAALQAVTGPLKDTERTFAPGVSDKLVEELLKIHVETISGESREIRGEFVEPVQLQLVCQSLWQDLPDDVLEITESHLHAFGNVDQVLSRFYDNVIRIAAADKAYIDESRLRTWVDDVLITSMGTRGTVYRSPESTAGIPNTVIDVLENQHLIRAEYRAGARWYELTHDRFIEPIRLSNKTYRARITGQSEDAEDVRHKALLAITQGEQAWGTENYEEALESFQKAEDLYYQINDQWGVASTANYTGLIYSQKGDYQIAIDHFKRALGIFEEIGDQWNTIIILTNMTRIYNLLKDHQTTDQLLQHADDILGKIGKSEETADIIVRLGYAYFSFEKYKKAVELFTDAIKLVPNNMDYYERRAVAYWYWGRYAEAITDFTVQIELDPNSFDAYNCRGQAFAEEGIELEKAVEDLNRAIKLGDAKGIPVAYARNGLGLAYGRQGKYELAFKEFDASIEESPENAWVYFNRALIYECMEKVDDAIKNYKLALEKGDPPLNNHKRKKAIERLRQLGVDVE